MFDQTELKAAVARLLYNDNRNAADYDLLVNFIDAMFRKQEHFSWRSVKDQLPEELPRGNPMWSEVCRPSYDVLVKRKGEKYLETAWYSYGNKEWVTADEERFLYDVIEWMYLPDSSGD